MKGKGFCLDISKFTEYWFVPESVWDYRLGPLRITSYLDGGYERHSVSIITKRMDMSVNLRGHSIPETVTQGDFSFSYQLGIPLKVSQKLIHYLRLLERQYSTNYREPTQFGNGMGIAGENGVPQRIATYLEAYWREVLKNEVSLLRERFTGE